MAGSKTRVTKIDSSHHFWSRLAYQSRNVVFTILFVLAFVTVLVYFFVIGTNPVQGIENHDGHSVKVQEEFSCYLENQFANNNHLPNTRDPNVVTSLILLQLLLDASLSSVKCNQAEITSTHRSENPNIKLEQISLELFHQKNILEAILQDIISPCVTTGVHHNHKKEIRNCLFLLNQYLEYDNLQNYQENYNPQDGSDSKPPKDLVLLLNSLVGRKDSPNTDLVDVLWDAIKCKDHQPVDKKLISPLLLRETIIGLLESTFRTLNKSNCLEFRNPIAASARKLLSRQDEVFRIQMNEQKVSDEMLRIIESQWGSNRTAIADALLQFLEKKYSERIWIVAVLSEGQPSQKIGFQTSRGFYTAYSNEIFASAVSVSRADPPEFSDLANLLLNDFKFPIETVSKSMGLGFSVKSKDRAQDFHQHFNRFLSPLWMDGKLGVESMSISTPCITAEKKIEDYVAIVASNNFKWKKITNIDECGNKQIIVVPTPFLKLEEEATKSLTHSDGVLRNEFGQTYLSVEHNSTEDGIYAILERGWRNSSEQRWRFVNNTLRNGNGKCLTAWTEKSWYLYQYDCHQDWAGQIWIRHGLQIVNGFRLCLALREVKENTTMYAVQDLCDSTLPFIWYDWACEEKMN